MKPPPPRSILITGASSGLGRALALAYAAEGVSLALCGRDRLRLEDTAATCRARGAVVDARILDVSDGAATAAWIAEVEARTPIDLVVANAGVSAGTAGGDESLEQTRRIFAVNLDGVLNTVMPVLPAMRARRRGQIAIVSSLAGFAGFAGAPAYCASKAAVRVWGESLRGWLAPEGIAVSVVCPGFVETAMTAVNTFRMPLLMPVDVAARRILAGLAADQPRIAFPWPLYWAARLFAALPLRLRDRIAGALPKKG